MIDYQIINRKNHWLILITTVFDSAGCCATPPNRKCAKCIDDFIFTYIDENLNLSHVPTRFSTKEDAEETLAKYLFAQEHLKKLHENKL